jgi:arsenate reductase (glutaredoxin)
MSTIYAYQNCSTCRDALKWLKANGLTPQIKAIRETPPSRAELEMALGANGGDLRKLFNTSGQDYRALGMKDKLPTMTRDEALGLLESNGNLVKRPFLIHGETVLVGFNAEAWEKALGNQAPSVGS